MFKHGTRDDASRRKVLISVGMLVLLTGHTNWVYALLMHGHSIVMLMFLSSALAERRA
jgi:hypothetical protein